MKVSLPAGFHLNPHLLKVALETPDTAKMTRELLASVKMIDTVSDETLRKLSESSRSFEDTTELLKATAHEESGVVDMVLPAVATLNRGRSIYLNLLEKDRDETNAHRLIAFFKERGKRRQLPDFYEFISSNDFVFRMLMRELYRASSTEVIRWMHPTAVAGQMTPAEARDFLETKDLENFLADNEESYDLFDQRLEDALRLVQMSLGGTLSLEQKVQIALAQSRKKYVDNFELSLRNFFNVDAVAVWSRRPGLLAGKLGVNDALWGAAGSSTFNLIGYDLISEINGLNKKEAPSTVIRRPTAREIEQYLKDRSPADWPYLQLAIDAVNQVMYLEHDILRDPVVIRERLRAGLFPIGEAIRSDVKVIETARRREAQAEKKLLPPKPSATLSVRKSGIRVATFQGNLVKGDESVVAPVPVKVVDVVVPPPSDVRPLSTLLLTKPKIGLRYAFKFPNSHEENFVVIDESVLAELKKKQQDLGPWVSAFLVGRTAHAGSNGLKTIVGMRGDIWEIKSVSVGFRVIVEQDKDTKTWRWLGLVPHSRVAQFCRDRRL